MVAFVAVVFGGAAVAQYMLAPVAESAPGPSLFSNSSVETANPTNTAPVSWQNGKWGTNTVSFTYPIGGAATGTRSVLTTVSKYSSGDAKWFPNPVGVSAGSYTYGDTYKSTVPTVVVAQFSTSANVLSYLVLASPAASTAWKTESFPFTVPAGTTTMTVFHVISRVGSLALDNVALQSQGSPSPSPSPTTTGTPPPGEMVPNPGAEQGSGSPTSWSTDAWGTHTSNFIWSTDAHSGSHALQTQVSGWVNGDAKWDYPPQPVTSGQYYTYSDWYKSTARTQVWLEMTAINGAVTYQQVSDLAVSSAYTLTSSTVLMPVGTAKARFMHVLSANGSLTIDDVSMRQVSQPAFRRGLVSVNFDDGWLSTYDAGLPILQRYGIPSTQYLVSGFLNQPNYITSAQAQAYVRAGQEVGGHTVDHALLTTLTPAQVTAELVNSQSALQALTAPVGQPAVTDFAYPEGDFNVAVENQVKQYYASARPTFEGYNQPTGFNPYRILVQNVLSTTTPAQVQGWIDQAVAHNYWLVLVYHQVDTSGSTYSVTPANLDAEMAAVKASGLAPLTMSAALAEVRAQ